MSNHQDIVENSQIDYDNKVSKSIWRKDRKTPCFLNIDVAGVHGLCCDIDEAMKKDNGNDHLDVNTVVERCNKLLVNAAGSSGNLIKVPCNVGFRNQVKDEKFKPWFNHKGKNVRKNYHRAKNYYWRGKTAEMRNNLVRESKKL